MGGPLAVARNVNTIEMLQQRGRDHQRCFKVALMTVPLSFFLYRGRAWNLKATLRLPHQASMVSLPLQFLCMNVFVGTKIVCQICVSIWPAYRSGDPFGSNRSLPPKSWMTLVLSVCIHHVSRPPCFPKRSSAEWKTAFAQPG